MQNIKNLLKEIFYEHKEEGYNKIDMQNEYLSAIDRINESECNCEDTEELQDYWNQLIDEIDWE